MVNKFELTYSALREWKDLPREEWKSKWIDKTRKYEYNTAFIYGSLLDGFLFDQEALKKNFVSYKGKDKPSEGIQGVIGLVAKNYDKTKDLPWQILKAARTLNFCKTFKDATIVAKFKGYDDYIQFCINNKYKTVVMEDYAREIQKIAIYLQTHEPNTIKRFIIANPSEDYSNKFQQTLRGNILGVPCKAILDILHRDEINSTIRVVDFKTTYDTAKFRESIIKYGYDMQGSFYETILKQNEDIVDGYTILPAMNIVIAKKDLDIYVHNYFEKQLEFCKKQWLMSVKEISDYLNKLKK